MGTPSDSPVEEVMFEIEPSRVPKPIPVALEDLCRLTKFTRQEIRIMYRGFKTMKFILFLFFCVLMVYTIQAESEKCFDKHEECHSTNYQSYVDCVRRRHKRSTGCNSSCSSGNCIDTCGNCDCNSCSYSNCDNTCDSCCSSCCSNYIPCRTNHCCHKTCQAQCKSTGCRSVCRKNCFETVKQTDETSSSNTSSAPVNDNRPNVTTIIHLNNIINNTNIVDVPISINYTNQNNISLNTQHFNTDSDTVNSTTKDCCIVISPRKCVPHKEFPFIRCFHYRSRQCGEYCTASIVHKEERQVCNYAYLGAPPNCQQQQIYIPQPQPRCSYQSTWPYVSCGIQRPASCSGCYNHYVNDNSKAYLTCPTGCYDDGFGVGPYYRQGPVYRPTYSHSPCDTFGAYGGCGGIGGIGGYGGYGGLGGIGGYGGYGGLGGIGGYGAYGGLGGFGVPNFGYGGYPAAGIPSVGSPQVPETSLGSWSPGEVNSFGYGNASVFNSSGVPIPIDPLISVGPGFSSPSGYVDPFRVSREVEIEVDYEPSSSAEAEVKIEQGDESNEQKNTSEKHDKSSTVSSVTGKLS